MSFGWQVKEKEKYFVKAEKMIKKAKLQEVLIVDRERFAIKGGKIVKVYVKKVNRKENIKEWCRAKRELSNFKEIKEGQESVFGKRAKSIYLDGYFEMEV